MDTVLLFNRWRSVNKIDFVPTLTPSIEEILGLNGLSIETEIARIRNLISSKAGCLDPEKYSWALSHASYSSVADAHMQFQLLKFLACAENRKLNSTAKVGYLPSRRLSPLVEWVDHVACIGMPTVFIKGLDEFYRCHFALRQFAHGLKEKAIAQMITTNYIGGKDIEIAYRTNLKGACLRLIQMISAYAASHLFECTSLDPSDFQDEEIYDPDGLASLTFLFKELGVTNDPCERSPQTPDVRAAVYLTNAFVLAHEISHMLNGDNSRICNGGRLDDDSAEDEQEAAADLLALELYIEFIISLGAHPDLEEIVKAFPIDCCILIGPAGFFAAASSVWLGYRLFRLPALRAHSLEDIQGKEEYRNLNKIRVRRALFNKSVFSYWKSPRGKNLGRRFDSVYGVLEEMYAMDFTMNAMRERMVGRPIT